MFPVFSLVLDEDVSSQVALTYPELYRELLKVLYSGVTIQLMWSHSRLCHVNAFFPAGKNVVHEDILDLGVAELLPRRNYHAPHDCFV